MVRESTEALAKGIGVKGLLNVQYALKDDILYVLEANPRASRTVPFVSKATAVPLAKACARVMLGSSIAQLREQGILPATGDGGEAPVGVPIAVKEAVLLFNRFRREDGTGVDTLLSPEMKSTGEVSGHRLRLRQGLPSRRQRHTDRCPPPVRFSCRWPTRTSGR